MTAFAAPDPLDRLEGDVRAILDPGRARALGTSAGARTASASLGAAAALALVGGAAAMVAHRAPEPVGRTESAATRVPPARSAAPPNVRTGAPTLTKPGLVASVRPIQPPERAAPTRLEAGGRRSPGPMAGRGDRPVARPPSPESMVADASIQAAAPLRPAPPARQAVSVDPVWADRPRVAAAFVVPASLPPTSGRSIEPQAAPAAPAPAVQEKRRARRESVDVLLTLRRQW